MSQQHLSTEIVHEKRHVLAAVLFTRSRGRWWDDECDLRGWSWPTITAVPKKKREQKILIPQYLSPEGSPGAQFDGLAISPLDSQHAPEERDPVQKSGQICKEK